MTPFNFGGRTEQLTAALKRLMDARVLMAEERWLGAMYLAGYAVECRLKAKLMEILNVWNLDELESQLARRFRQRLSLRTHELEILMTFLDRLVGIRSRMRKEILRDYTLCSRWQTQFRYSPLDATKYECESFFEAVERFSKFISTSC